jgi:hypothetical protein
VPAMANLLARPQHLAVPEVVNHCSKAGRWRNLLLALGFLYSMAMLLTVGQQGVADDAKRRDPVPSASPVSVIWVRTGPSVVPAASLPTPTINDDDFTSAAAPQSATTVPPSPSPVQPTASVAATPGSTVATWRTVLDEHFTDNGRGWLNPPDLSARFTSGAYRLLSRGSGHVAVAAPVVGSFGDVEVTATFQRNGGLAGGGYGVIVRDAEATARDGQTQSGRYYVFGISDVGYVGIWRREEDHWVALLPWTPSVAVRRGEVANELTVRAVGPRFMFTVNGVEVGVAEDRALAEGGVGLFAKAGDRDALQDVSVTHFSVAVPRPPSA